MRTGVMQAIYEKRSEQAEHLLKCIQHTKNILETEKALKLLFWTLQEKNTCLA